MSKIEWTEKTWNPIIGCSEASTGCKNCYAQVMATRLAGMKATPNYKDVAKGGKWTGVVRFNASKLIVLPLITKKPTMFFVCSMSDLFHKNVSDNMIDEIFGIMRACPQHTFQLLTKRAKRLREYLDSKDMGFLPKNVWLGVSCENQKTLEERALELVKIKQDVSVRYLSLEPLLSKISFKIPYEEDIIHLLTGYILDDDTGEVVGDVFKINWVIVGGESGKNARLFDPNWIFDIWYNCDAHKVSFFFKQWGATPPVPDVFDQTREFPKCKRD